MAALTRCYFLSPHMKRVADFTLHRLQNIGKSPGQCQPCKQFATLSKVKPTKYPLCIRSQVRNFKHRSESSKPGFLSQIIKPLGFTVLVGSTSFALMAPIMSKSSDNRSLGDRSLFKMVVIGLIGINAIVLMLWRVPQLHSFMTKYFTCTNGSPVISMLLSSFSHTNGVHLFMNMYCFWSFSDHLFGILPHLALVSWLYVNGAIVSSLTSLIVKAARVSPIPSVGASGAILACIACVCYNYPKATLGFPIISNMTGFYFTAENGLKGLILVDLCGIIFRWKLLDHAGHLGGVLFGLWFMHYGQYHMAKIINKYKSKKKQNQRNKTLKKLD